MPLLFQRIRIFFDENIQINQTLLQICILILGVTTFGLFISPLQIFVTFLTTISLDAYLYHREKGVWQFPYSGLNAGFGICYFLRADSVLIYIVAGILAISLKHLIQANGRHFLNPSGAAVFLILVFVPQLTWTNPLQWSTNFLSGSKWFLFMVAFVFLGGMLLMYRLSRYKKRQQYDLPVVFILSHIILFGIFTDWRVSMFYIFFSPGFFIHTFNMITDPKTTPELTPDRILYSLSLSTLFYILWYFINENYSLLGALFLLTCLLPFIWKFQDQTLSFGGRKFHKSTVFLGGLFLSFLLSLGILISLYGTPDLLFTNRCTQIICRP